MDPLVDRLSQLSLDVFIQQITYLPFRDVVSVCSANKKLHGFCNDPKHNARWKALINNTFSDVIYNYPDKLNKLWDKLNITPNTYNYLVYTQLVKLLDPVTQGMIYYRQGDDISFNQLTKEQKFLALFLLGNKNKMMEYIPDHSRSKYVSFMFMLIGDEISEKELDEMLMEMATEGNMKGIMLLKEKGANIRAQGDSPLILASRGGYLEVVKYLVEHEANVQAHNNLALRDAIVQGHSDVVDYLMEHGAVISWIY